MSGAFMSRLDGAVARLRTGDAVLLTDETRDGTARLVAAASVVTETAARLLRDDGRGPVTALEPGSSARHAGAPRDDVAAQRLRGLDVVAGQSRPGGVLARAGFSEAASDLLAAAGLDGPALVRDALLPGGVLADAGETLRLARRRGIAVVSIQDVAAHRLAAETIVEHAAVAKMPSLYAADPLEAHAFRSLIDASEHLALVRRPESGLFGPEPLVRLHSECLTGDALGSLRCDCGEQLRRALKQIGDDPQGGVLVYLRGQEGRGIGLANKIRAYALQERGFDTLDANTELGFPADLRDYGVAVQILRQFGIGRLRLLANNPAKRTALERYGIVVTERRPLRIGPNPHNASYLETKRLRMGHDLAPGLRVVSDT